jgi:hypothetical protein
MQVVPASTTMTKKYSEMTAAERLADRIAKNREMERRVEENQKTAPRKPARVAAKPKNTGDTLSEFQRIKKERGIDAAAEFVRSKVE